MHLGVVRVRRDGLREVAEVAIEVDVVLVGAADVREAVRIERMQEHDAHAGVLDRPSTNASSRRKFTWQPEPQKPSTPCVPEIRTSTSRASATSERRDVDRQLFALRPARDRMDVARHRQAARLGGVEERSRAST